jgi:hypothetical protein
MEERVVLYWGSWWGLRIRNISVPEPLWLLPSRLPVVDPVTHTSCSLPFEYAATL